MKAFALLTVIALLIGSGWFQSRPDPPAQRVTFLEVPSSQSKITWVHDNGRSELRHLPETCGGGGLFFDFDNDGWMDIYLVNSGPSDFYMPKTPIRNALYRNNGDGTFTDVTEKAGVACGQMGNCLLYTSPSPRDRQNLVCRLLLEKKKQ